jgi:hypothetical protein
LSEAPAALPILSETSITFSGKKEHLTSSRKIARAPRMLYRIPALADVPVAR